MSRSAFAEHFVATFGQAPFEFLTEVRLRRAAGLLEATDIPIKTIAGTVGYASRPSVHETLRSDDFSKPRHLICTSGWLCWMRVATTRAVAAHPDGG
jgi:transcriptional regulator GlxA family with amidase domain